MSEERVAYIREQNNNTTASRLFTDNQQTDASVPNPIEQFEQCFSEYPDLLGKFSISADLRCAI